MYAKRILQSYRNVSEPKMIADEESITLTEFFMFLREHKTRPRSLDTHFRPMTEFACGFCQVKYVSM